MGIIGGLIIGALFLAILGVRGSLPEADAE